jgi:uncharacterized protein YndB with AHSA1/START domain
MSVKVEPSGRRSIAVETEVPGSPEEVWRAIATGPGVTAWFVPSRIDGRVGGEVVSDFGPGMEATATITEWEAPHRFVAEGDIAPGAPTMATEWTVEARGGGTCVVRVVHSLFADSDEWDGQLTGAESGWPTWFGVLRLYLAHFAGQPSAAIRYFGFGGSSPEAVWRSALDGLGLAGAAPGDRREAPAGPPPFAGEVVSGGADVPERHMLVRLDRPAPGAAGLAAAEMGGQTCLVAYLFFYGPEAAATVAREEPAWREWLDGRFAAGG